MKPLSLRWQFAITALLVSALSVGIGAGAMLYTGHTQSQERMAAATHRELDAASSEMDALWHRTMGRLSTLSSALGSHPTNESFGIAVSSLRVLGDGVTRVEFDDGVAQWQRPLNATVPGLVVAASDDPRLRMIVDAAAIQAVLDRHSRLLEPPGVIIWDEGAGMDTAFGGRLRAEQDLPGLLAIQPPVLVQAAATGAVVAAASGAAAALAGTLLVRPLKRFEADARALAEGRRPEGRGGSKELARLSRSMQQAAADVARERHELQVVQEKLGATVRRQTRAVAEQEARFQRLFEGISHDIKGPLITANVLLQQVQREGSDGSERLDRAMIALKRLRALVLELGLLSRASTQATMAPFDLGPLVKAAVDDACRDVANASHVQWSGPNIVLRSDAERLRLAMRMLIDNGLRHGGNVRVQWVAGPVPCIRIMDDGPGFVFAPNMLEPFAVRSDQPGVAAGLGLPIANRLVRSLGGGLQIRSDAAGTRCAIFLPEGT